MAEKEFFSLSLGKKRGFSHFVLHVKRRHRGREIKRPFDLYWWVELNFGQEIYVTVLRKNGLIAGLAKIDFFPEMASTKLKYCLSKI